MTHSQRMRLRIALDSRRGLQCFNCGKHLNRKNLAYKPFIYPAGTVEFVPVCVACKEAKL